MKNLSSFVLGIEKNFIQSLSVFLLVIFDGKGRIAFKSSYFHPLIIGFFWFAKLKFIIEEKIHTKAVVFRGGEATQGKSGSCSTWGQMPYLGKGFAWVDWGDRVEANYGLFENLNKNYFAPV